MKIPKKYQDRIYSVYQDEDGWWCELNRGWCYDQESQHLIHEDTRTDILKCIRLTKECKCDECTKGTGFTLTNPDGVKEF